MLLEAISPGYSHVKAYGVHRPNGLLFHQNPFCSKKSLEDSPISQKLGKNCKIRRFEVETPVQMGLDLRKFRKNHQISLFLREKNP